MPKLAWLIVCVIMLQYGITQSPWSIPQQQQSIEDIEKELVSYWEAKTGRTSVKLPLALTMQEDMIFSLSLVPRYRREMILEVKITPTAIGSSTAFIPHENDVKDEINPTKSENPQDNSASTPNIAVFSCLAQGVVSDEKVREILQNKLTALFAPIQFTWEWKTEPIGYAIVTKRLVDLYMAPVEQKGDNLATQAFYGTPLILWQKSEDEKFYRVQNTVDGYISWIEAKDIQIVQHNIWNEWNQLPKHFLARFPNHPYLMVGASVGWKKQQTWWWDVSQQTIVPLQLQENQIIATNSLHPDQIILTAKRLLPQGDLAGTTYLWGGVCPPQLDCSGFVQFVFHLHGILLPRDSDQQYQATKRIEQSQLQPGDLLFFSSHGRHPTHVGLYIGDDCYIHCSPAGSYSGIKLNFLHGKTEYEQMLLRLYYGAGRILQN